METAIDYTERAARKRRRKARVVPPLSGLTIRGMRQPMPVGDITAQPGYLARMIKSKLKSFRRPGRVYVLGGMVYVVCDAYAVNGLFELDPRAELAGTYRRSVSREQLTNDIAALQLEMLARVHPVTA